MQYTADIKQEEIKTKFEIFNFFFTNCRESGHVAAGSVKSNREKH